MAASTKHDTRLPGVLRTRDGTALASLSDVVRWTMKNGDPLVESSSLVLNALKQQGDSLDLFKTDPVRFAEPVALLRVIRKGDPGQSGGYVVTDGSWLLALQSGQIYDLPWRPGRSATSKKSRSWIDIIHAAWAGKGARLEYLDRQPFASFAINIALAESMFGYGIDGIDASAGVGDPAKVAAVATAQIVQPEGGAWKHQRGAEWTDCERAAMFTMRHKNKMAGEKIADIVGVKRQWVDELIGKVSSPTNNQWPEACKWRPSAALLLACGLHVSYPLQVVIT